jgi:hypothetical protein
MRVFGRRAWIYVNAYVRAVSMNGLRDLAIDCSWPLR